MKKNILLLSTLSLFFCTVSIAQSYTFQFEKPVLNKLGNGYTEILYQDAINMGEEGAPEMPYLGVNLLMPPGEVIGNIIITDVTYYPTETGIKIKPATKPVPISLFDGNHYIAEPQDEIYASSDPYPSNQIENISTHFLCGHGIGSFTICPVVYIPSSSEAKFIKEITIRISPLTSIRAAEAPDFLRKSPLIQKRINTIVKNPEVLSDYSYTIQRDDDPYDILLISKADFLPEFDDYVAFKESRGYLVKTISVEEIYGVYSGDDDQMKIRNCIIDYYTNNGISYVILAGDADPATPSDRIIPHRGFKADDDNDIACDMYYSNLDGSWNNDGDNSWGEPGEEDLYSEVHIGRLCVDNTDEIENFVNKLTLYQDQPVLADIDKALIIGEQLNSYTWGGTYKDEIVNGSSANGYTTVGFPPNFVISKLYEMLEMWDKNDVFNEFDNVGVNLLNHLGHSNVTYNMKMYNSDLTTSNFTNDGVTRGFVIGYSQGCYNGSFDNRGTGGSYGSDCFAETFTGLETGEVATVANSRYGWYNPGGTNSSSQYYDRMFFDALFGQNITTAGSANAGSKEYDVSYITGDENWKWVAYETNLFGDPSMDIWTAQPADMVVNYPPSITIGSSELLVQTDAPYARIAIVQNGELIGRGNADENGDVNVTFPIITNPAPLEISITAHNKNRHNGTVLIVSNQPYIVYYSHLINDILGNDNGFADYGESVYLSLAITNVGDQPSISTMATLSSSDPYVTITDDTESFGIIQPGNTILKADAFAFDLAANVPDEHEVEFDVEVVSQDTWNLSFKVVAHAPELTIGKLIVNDTAGGNSNGNLDPGEEVEIIFISSNLGHSDCYDATGLLTSTSPFINIIEENFTIGDLAAGAVSQALFTVDVDDFAPIGGYVDLNYSFTSGEYDVEKAFTQTVGLVFEDWESGSFDKFNWSSSSTWPWQISHMNGYEGDFGVCSGIINNEETSNLKLTYKCIGTDSISFFRRTSSEEDCDYLKFYIDDVLKGEWSGMLDWERVAFTVLPGVHQFKWEYEKDAENKAGYDCVWIDYIVLPPTDVTTCYPGPDTSICEGEDYQCTAIATNFTSLLWSTSGTGTFSENDILNPMYYPSQLDYTNGSVELSLTAFSNLPCGDITRNFSLSFILLPSVPDMPQGPDYVDLYYFNTSEYTIDEAANAVSYQWNLEPAEAGAISGNNTTGLVEWNMEFLGEAFVSVMSINDCGESEYSEAFEVTVDNTVGLDNTTGNNQISVIPNPNTGQFMLKILNAGPGIYTIKIISSSGTILYQEKELYLEKELLKTFDLSTLDKGVYYLMLENSNKQIIRKMVIIN